MHDDRHLVEDRIAELHRRLVERSYRVVAPLRATAWPAPGEPVPFAEAAARDAAGDFTPFEPGTWWGPAWSTWWIRLDGTVPDDLGPHERDRLEARVDLGFEGDWAGNQSEGLFLTASGHPLKGVNPMNRTVRLTSGETARRRSEAGEPLIDEAGRVRLYVEAAANPDLGEYMNRPTPDGDVLTRGSRPLWQYRGAELVVRDDDSWHLGLDVEVLNGLMHALPEDSTHRARLLRALERAADLVDAGGPQALRRARQILAPMISSGANASAQRFSAVGHAHIDSAWLWPLRETRRKIVRTCSNVVALAEEYPDLRFACTSAQHYQWLREDSPQTYGRVVELIRAGQWDVVGGMWVEPDTNLPSGESLVRQLTSGLRWSVRELGVRPRCLWLPDSFGYTGSLPQIARLAGMTWFFTQKMSWNSINTMPHHSFWWEGIDGTRLWTHFPPVDCYDSVVSPQQVLEAERGFKEKGRTPHSLLPFGYGDGGGGPVREMVERVRRLADLEDAPVVRPQSPEEFHDAAIAYEQDAPVWVGEMYLELHRGVYTSNHALKQGNRRTEAALSALEWLALEAQRAPVGYDYPHEALDELWQRTALLQFHDILTGSSTSWVNRDAREEYTRLAEEITSLTTAAWNALTGAEPDSAEPDSGAPGEAPVRPRCTAPLAPRPAASVVNTSPGPRRDVVTTPDGSLVLVALDGRSASPVQEARTEPAHPVSLVREGGSIVLDNGLLRVSIAADGTLSSVLDLVAGRQLLLPGGRGNLLVVHPDHPSCFDAWELQHHYQHGGEPLDAVESLEVVQEGPLRAAVSVTRVFGRSRAVQTLALDADSKVLDLGLTIDWQERARVLKVSFPLDVRASHATSEIQFGSIDRPVAPNTSWDAARFETCAHRWLLLEEPGYGIALVNESTYGHDVLPAEGSPAAPTRGVTARLTLLRASQAPDPQADRGRHEICYGLVADADRTRARRAGERVNEPLRILPGSVHLTAPASLTPVSGGAAAVLDTVKSAFDTSGDLVLRLHEEAGARGSVDLRLAHGAHRLVEVDLLEEPVPAEERTQDLPDAAVGPGGAVRLHLRPFQILTLRTTRA